MKRFVLLLLVGFTLALPAQNWMESMEIATILARGQNKLVLMVWQEASEYPLSVIVENDQGRDIYIKNIFESPELTKLLWTYFIPVKVDEVFYEDMLKEIEGKRNQNYIDSFNDDSLKILDPNGNILGTTGSVSEVLNLSNFIGKYNLNTSYLKQELVNYFNKKDFYTSFYLASKYLDYSILVNKSVRPEILRLANIYFSQAEQFLETDNELKNKATLGQRIVLTKLKEDLIKGKPKKVLRQLKKIDDSALIDANKSLKKFLEYTSYKLLRETEKFSNLEKDISLLNLKLAQAIVNINPK